MVIASDERMDKFFCKTPDGSRMPQDISAYRVILKYELFEIIEYQLSRIILAGVNFIDYNFLFSVEFFLREGGIENNIPDELNGTFIVIFKERGVYTGFFLGCVSIEFPAYVLQPAENVICLSLFCPLKHDMFNKMSHAVLLRSLIPRTGMDQESTIGYR